MVSREHRCIFVHIPKTAGTSIEHQLNHFDTLRRGVQDHRLIREIEPWNPKLARLWRTGTLILVAKRLRNTMRGEGPVSDQIYGLYFKFAFVRSPWARVYSWYKNVMRDEVHRRYLCIPDRCSFQSFLTNYPDQWALRSQFYWIRNISGQIPLDFIGRFESLRADFEKVCVQLGIEDSSLPQLVPGDDGPKYYEVYDDITKDIVYNRYRDEIEYFGFSFR